MSSGCGGAGPSGAAESVFCPEGLVRCDSWLGGCGVDRVSGDCGVSCLGCLCRFSISSQFSSGVPPPPPHVYGPCLPWAGSCWVYSSRVLPLVLLILFFDRGVLVVIWVVVRWRGLYTPRWMRNCFISSLRCLLLCRCSPCPPWVHFHCCHSSLVQVGALLVGEAWVSALSMRSHW